MCGIVGCHFNIVCLLHQLLMSADGKIRWVISRRYGPRNLVSSQRDIVHKRIEADAFDIAYLIGFDSILLLHAHD